MPNSVDSLRQDGAMIWVLSADVLLLVLDYLRQPDVLALARVCHRSRRIARTHRFFYAHIALLRGDVPTSYSDYVRDVLSFCETVRQAHADGVPLSIALNLVEDVEHYSDDYDYDDYFPSDAPTIAVTAPTTAHVLPVLAQSMPSIARLDLVVRSEAYTPDLLSVLSRPAPLLETLKLSWPAADLWFGLPSELFASHAPRLARVDISAVAFPSDDAIGAFSSVRALRLFIKPDAKHIDIALHFPALVSFGLEALWSDRDPHSNVPSPRVGILGGALQAASLPLAHVHFHVDDMPWQPSVVRDLGLRDLAFISVTVTEPSDDTIPVFQHFKGPMALHAAVTRNNADWQVLRVACPSAGLVRETSWSFEYSSNDIPLGMAFPGLASRITCLRLGMIFQGFLELFLRTFSRLDSLTDLEIDLSPWAAFVLHPERTLYQTHAGGVREFALPADCSLEQYVENDGEPIMVDYPKLRTLVICSEHQDMQVSFRDVVRLLRDLDLLKNGGVVSLHVGGVLAPPARVTTLWPAIKSKLRDATYPSEYESRLESQLQRMVHADYHEG